MSDGLSAGKPESERMNMVHKALAIGPIGSACGGCHKACRIKR
jgi:cytochrome c556